MILTCALNETEIATGPLSLPYWRDGFWCAPSLRPDITSAGVPARQPAAEKGSLDRSIAKYGEGLGMSLSVNYTHFQFGPECRDVATS